MHLQSSTILSSLFFLTITKTITAHPINATTGFNSTTGFNATTSLNSTTSFNSTGFNSTSFTSTTALHYTASPPSRGSDPSSGPLLDPHGKTYCYPDGPYFNAAHLKELAYRLKNFSPKAVIALPHQHGRSYHVESAKACVSNIYIAKNTHVSNLEVGNAVQIIYDYCCEGLDKDLCRGGYHQGHGDSGLKIDIETTNSGVDCP